MQAAIAMEEVMLRSLASVIGYAAVLVLFTTPVPAAQYGTAEEAKVILKRAVAAVKKDYSIGTILRDRKDQAFCSPKT